jgi:3-phenylpropionate/trans-cinnamate dioxygenase ferredoxin reductase subunit
MLVGREPDPPYERPPLSKTFLLGHVEATSLPFRSRADYAALGVELDLGVKAEAVHLDRQCVELADGRELAYDQLLIATGGRARRLPAVPDALYLRRLDDAERVREVLRDRRLTIIGAGFIGSEVAASLRQRGLDVHVVAGGTAPLDRVLGEDVGRVLEGIHRDHGVTMTFDDRVEAFEGNGRVNGVTTANGLHLECDFVVLGLGVDPVTAFLDGSGIAVDDGVTVDERCRASVDGVFAAGDVANHVHPVFGRRIRVEHWQNAISQGRIAALNMMGRDTPYEEIPWFWSDQYEHTVQYAGHHREWDDLVIRGSLEDRSFAAFYVLDGRVQAVVSVDRPSDVRDAMPLIRAGGHAAREQLRDDTLDLASLG